jgi:hypothetical protein
MNFLGHGLPWGAGLADELTKYEAESNTEVRVLVCLVSTCRQTRQPQCLPAASLVD